MVEGSYSSRILPTSHIEENFPYEKVIVAIRAVWLYCIPLALAYYAAVSYGERYMAERKAYNLRRPLVIWSGLLAVFSWLGTIRITVLLALSIRFDGLLSSVCGIRDKLDSPSWFWLYLFVLSKLPELGDTFFIIARKSKLHFLHWYHHMTVFVYSCYLAAYPQSGMVWYAGMNFAVHALMYTYYTLRAARVRLPRACALFVTTCQLSQMVVGVGLQIVCAYMLYMGQRCDTSVADIAAGMAIYFSYMVLFAKFFYNSYIAPNKPKTA